MKNNNLFMKNKEKGSSILELSLAFSASAALIVSSFFTTSLVSGEQNSNSLLAAVLNDLEDINVESPSVGDTLVWNGETWVNGRLGISQLGNTQITNPTAGDYLIFSNGTWINRAPETLKLEDIVGFDITSTPQVGQSIIFNGESWSAGFGGDIGEIKLWSTSSAPEGWLIADGREVSRTTYAELFAAIGTTYGAGNGSTTFNLPDMRGKVAVGRDSADTDFNALGKTGGAKTHTLTVAEMPSHTHTQQPHSHTGSTNEAGAHDHDVTLANAGLHSHTVASTSAGSHQHQTPSRNVVRSIKTGTGNTGRALFSTWTTAGEDFWNHTHNYSLGSAGGHSHTVTLNSAGGHSHTLSLDNATAINNPAGGGEAHNNLQPYAVSHFIIKF